MGLGDLFRKMLGGGGGGEKRGEAVEYKGCQIIPAPRAEGGRYYTAGIITKRFGEEVREHRFVRADTYDSPEGASQHAVAKGQQLIDEQGDGLFPPP